MKISRFRTDDGSILLKEILVGGNDFPACPGLISCEGIEVVIDCLQLPVVNAVGYSMC